MKLSTKAKLNQMKVMLRQLEDEVKGNSNDKSSTDDWGASDVSMNITQHGKSKTETNDTTEEDETDNDTKHAAITTLHQFKSLPAAAIGETSPGTSGESNHKPEAVINSVQAKLAKELIKLANTYKVPELMFSNQAGRHCFGYQTWFKKLRPILAIFPETSEVIQGDKIVPFKDVNCVRNKALYLIIGSWVDAYIQRAIRKLEGKGDQALLLIKNQCVSTTADHTHHFHHLFTSIRIRENESATIFFPSVHLCPH
jgi:hypothetical protein